MATTVSLDYLSSMFAGGGGVLTSEQLSALYNAANGIPQLDATGIIPDTLLSEDALGGFLGSYTDIAALFSAHPTANYGQYAYVAGVTYYYNAARNDGSWSSVEIQPVVFDTFSPEVKAGQPEWLIIPNPL